MRRTAVAAAPAMLPARIVTCEHPAFVARPQAWPADTPGTLMHARFWPTLAGLALWTLVAAAALAATPPAAPPAAPAPTADEIIARHVEARGGAAALAALTSLRREGILRLPGFALELRTSELRARPGMLRQEATLQGMTAVTAWDGHEAWQISPFQGRKDPEKSSADDAKPLALAADLDTPLVDYRAKGHAVDYLGLEDVDGTPAYKLRVRLKSGDQVTYFIDPDTYMIIRDVQKQTVRGAEQEVETDYGEYEKVGGVYVAMAEESGPRGSDSSQKQKVAYARAEANVAIDPRVFAFPAAK